MALGFLASNLYRSLIHNLNPNQAHGYATEEFEVTIERLGVYLPVSSLLYSIPFRASNACCPIG